MNSPRNNEQARLSKWIDSLLSSSLVPSRWRMTTRTGTILCDCGSIQYDLVVPPSSQLVEQTNAVCHCRDCVGFCLALPNGDSYLQNNGSFMVNFYKSDLQLVKGRDMLSTVRLYPHSTIVRIYCGECHTPLGADLVGAAPICLVNETLIHETYSVRFLPSIVLGYKDALHGTKPYARSVSVKWRNYGPLFLWKSICRVIWGWLVGKSRGGFLENDYNRDFPVGLDGLKKATTQ
ncbi:hypothetical protein IV203_020014 [Nitzschia inconspicua]|uniref:CENP-V/GFA domain-containing protein n=1 Tax=Nitzschia inconspicua TaxID=303405 RepID=A0A9K3Q7W0_9STRA|nr:hypothetical protein IV203_020014 [Nitzschia inconspicua]